MNWFLDMCIVIFYASRTNDAKEEKTRRFVKNKKKDKYFLCYYVADRNLPGWIKRQGAVFEELKNKIKNPSYEIGSSYNGKLLYEKDKIIVKKLYTLYQISEDKDSFFQKAKKSNILMLSQVGYFLKNYIDKKVIPEKEIDFELKSAIFTFTNNHSDSLTIASGIQYHQKEKLVLLTGDKNDWTKENLEWVFASEPNLKKKYKIPEIKYIQKL